MSLQPVPPGFHTVTPSLVVDGCAEAIEWYRKALGAEEEFRNTLPNGQVIHARIRIGDSPIMMSDAFPEMGATGPAADARSPVTIHLYVDDVDAAWDRAVAAGATPTMPLQDMFWGDRFGCLRDPFHHGWSLATRIEDLSDAEISERSQAHLAEGFSAERGE